MLEVLKVLEVLEVLKVLKVLVCGGKDAGFYYPPRSGTTRRIKEWHNTADEMGLSIGAAMA